MGTFISSLPPTTTAVGLLRQRRAVPADPSERAGVDNVAHEQGNSTTAVEGLTLGTLTGHGVYSPKSNVVGAQNKY